MDNKLQQLISLYEEEKLQLQKIIDNYLEETEYLMVHYHTKALNQINRKLQTLNNLDDKLFDEKYFRQNMIERLEKRVEEEPSDYMKEFFIKQIRQTKQEIENLNLIPQKETLAENKNLLDHTLEKLMDNRIKKFKLILKKSNNLLLIFDYSDRVLKVNLPHVRKHIKNYILHDKKIKSFENLGFQMNKKETKLKLILSGEKRIILEQFKLILSKIIFEIFYFKEFDKESYIEITENIKD